LNIWQPLDWELEIFYWSFEVAMRSSILDIKEQADLKTFNQLLNNADIFFSNKRPGYQERHGLTGLFTLEGTPNNPRLSTIQVVCDNIAAWLSTVGIMSAVRRRAVEGGSYRVAVSLTRVTLWLLSLGIFDKKYYTKELLCYR
jgi:crotonobetainyl-CoA:carnitine CoA-transferase CaiB-like acyl-CoA transferase